MLENRVGGVGLVFTCISVGITGAFLLMGWVSSAGASSLAPGVELGPNHIGQADAGQTIIYDHIVTNTGTTTDTFIMEFASTQGWPTVLLGDAYPTGTLTLMLPLQVGSQMTASFQVSLTVPLGTAGVTEITVITATSQLSPTVQDTAIDTTIVEPYRVYLPVVLKRWPLMIHISGRVTLEDGTGLADVEIYSGATYIPVCIGWPVTATNENGDYQADLKCPVGHDETLRVCPILEGYTFAPQVSHWRTYGYCPDHEADFVGFPVDSLSGQR